MSDVPAHDQQTTHHYLMHYPEHPERTGDPHYKDFDTFRRHTKATARCQFATDTGDNGECHGGLELHHSHIEFSLQNGVDLARLEHAYPGVSNPDEIGAWIETAENLVWMCAGHHRGPGGVHTAAAADFEASKFVRRLIT
ncbi:MAG TPA: hypothetical protein VGH54_27985 [Mycobacterium sp.]|uniref:hypothetical protein n=1 Tax=Mycobacterium sp. TaxID=1785 RepID=UPI002F409627